MSIQVGLTHARGFMYEAGIQRLNVQVLQGEGCMTDQIKQRHGCLTASLVLMIIVNSLVALIYLLGSEAIRQNLPTVPGWAFPVLILLSIANLVCAIALFKWKKWGFFGFTGTAVVAFAINLVSGINIIQGLVACLAR